MRGWSLPLGRWMGVEMRLHTFFLLLALVCLGLGVSESGQFGFARGMGLFFVLVAAVVVRETARLLVAAWLGLRLRAILLLPIGGLFAYANPESQEHIELRRRSVCPGRAGPVANLLTALALAGLFLGAGGNFDLLGRPLVTSGHLLRSMVWMQAGLGVCICCPHILWTAAG